MPSSQSYHLFSTADEYSEPTQSEQEVVDLMTLQRLLNLAVDDTPGKVRNALFVHTDCTSFSRRKNFLFNVVYYKNNLFTSSCIWLHRLSNIVWLLSTCPNIV